MKKTLLSALVLLGSSFGVSAENLLDIYQLAQQKDPQLQQAKALRDQAVAAIDESRAALLPQINANAGFTYRKDKEDGVASQTGDTKSYGLALDQSIYRRSQWVSLDLSEKSAAQADVSYTLEEQGLMLRTAQAYFDVLKAMDTLAFVRANKVAVERQLEQTQQRFAVGLTAITDVHEAEASRDQALADEIRAENTLANNYEVLRELTGIEHRQLDVLNTERFEPQAPALDAAKWLDMALDKNLQLHRARIGKEIANEQISLAQTGHEPTLGLTAGLNGGNIDFDNGSERDLDESNIGLSLSVPIFSGGATSARVKQAQYGYVAASEQLEQSLRSVQSSLRSSYNNVNASIGSVRAYSQSVISASSALKATEAGYEVGTRTIVDVLEATRKLYEAKQKLSEARYNYILSILTLKQSAGVLSAQDLADINQGLQATPKA
ncbi:MAG: outer membrane channel protein TolC [Aeromonas sp.]